MHLIIWEITLDLNWSENFVKVATNEANQGATFSITDTKLYVPVVTLSTQEQISSKSINRKTKSIFRLFN